VTGARYTRITPGFPETMGHRRLVGACQTGFQIRERLDLLNGLRHFHAIYDNGRAASRLSMARKLFNSGPDDKILILAICAPGACSGGIWVHTSYPYGLPDQFGGTYSYARMLLLAS